MKTCNIIPKEFIEKSMQVAHYVLKENTKSSYYMQHGSSILPNRLSISKDEITYVQHKGRNIQHPTVGQLLGQFKVAEESPLKQHKPYYVRTQIWQLPLYPTFIGYGTIGISSESGKVVGDTGDLVVLYTTDQWESISIFYFAGMGNINDMEQVMSFLSRHIDEREHYITQKKGVASQQDPSNWIIND